MSAAKALFRDQALEQLESPEQLDQLLRVTKPAGWIGLVAVAVVIATGLAWSLFGSIDSKVRGPGILINPGGTSLIESLGSGRLEQLLKRVGDEVSEGETVAILALPELHQELQAAQALLTEAIRAQGFSATSRANESDLQLQTIAGQRNTLRLRQEAARRRITQLEKRLEDRKELLVEGLITEEQVFVTENNLATAKEDLKSAADSLSQLAVQQSKVNHANLQAKMAGEFKVAEAQRQVDRLREEYRLRREVVSPYAGRVIEITADIGREMGARSPLMMVEGEDAALQAIVYVSPLDGKRVKPNMPILVAPSATKKEEHGMMIGKVTRVSEFPATREGMLARLNNDELLKLFLKNGPPIAVEVTLIPDPNTVSGWKWTSGTGAPIRLTGGTVCTADVTVQRRAPIELVIPYLKTSIGL